MRIFLLACCLLPACIKVVKTEGFRVEIGQATDAAMANRSIKGEGAPSCGSVSPGLKELHMERGGFRVDVTDRNGEVDAVLVLGPERYLSDRPGGEARLAADAPGGRIIGSLTGTLVHESAGTRVGGRPAPIREMEVSLTFNLQPCP
ncbi:MAG: hypothetical protein AB8H79_09060 [Myxococcota bacterium]